MKTIHRYALPALLLITSFAGTCGRKTVSVDWTTSVDTVNGIVHVINTPPDAGARATLIGSEELRIGSADKAGPTAFGRIRQVAVLPDGRFAVADAQAEEVRLFDRDGTYLRTFGGEGGGPGELKGMQGVYVDQDGLLRVAEQGNARLSVFDPDKGFVRSYPLRLYSYGFNGPWEAAVDSTGRTYVASSGPVAGRSWRMVRVYDSTMTQLDSLPYHDYTDEIRQDEVPGAWKVALGSNAWTWAEVPFYARPWETLSRTGGFWSSAQGTPDLEVARWNAPGDTSLILVSRRPPVPVTAAERDSAMDALTKRLGRRMADPPKLDGSKVPSTKPPLYGLSLDDRGRLWVRLTDPVADTTAYDVFDADGVHAETVSLPFRIDPWIPPVVRGDTLWGVVTDEMDVQYVVRARLHRPGEGG